MVTPWLYAMARHKLIDAYRRRGQRIDVEIDEIAETLRPRRSLTASTSARSARRWTCWRPASAPSLPAISVEGRSIGETAASLGMSETAKFRVALHRGLAVIAGTLRTGLRWIQKASSRR